MSFCKVHLVGRLAKKPELKTINESLIATMSIAVNRKQKDQDVTDWFYASAFGKQAETMAKYLDKGEMVAVHGDLIMRSWDKDGEKRTSPEIRLTSFSFMPNEKKKQDTQVATETNISTAPAPKLPNFADNIKNDELPF